MKHYMAHMDTSETDKPAKKRSLPCKCGCGERFSPTKKSQIFVNENHRKRFWREVQSYGAVKDYQKFLLVRDKFARYLKYEKRIEAWLKANKK
jgi:hypothetical protein